MKKAKFGVILFIVSALLFFCFVVQKNKKNNISKIECYYINDNNIKELIQIGMRKPMPKIVDVIETGDFQINNKPLHLSEICYVDIREGTKYGFTILYELGQGESIQCIDADKYTVFLSDREGGLWYWDSKMIKFHDCKDAIADPEGYGEDYAGNWKSVNIKEILGRENESGYAPYIVKICAGSENVFFLTNDGQVFMSEYITNAVEDVDYYNNTSTNPNRERILTAKDLNLKTITFHKMDWEDIISINTDGTHFFSAVDKDGRYYYFSAEL